MLLNWLELEMYSHSEEEQVQLKEEEVSELLIFDLEERIGRVDVVGNEARAAANALDPMGWQVRRGREKGYGRRKTIDK